MIFEDEIIFQSKKELDLVDLTERVEKIIERSGIKDGLCCVFCPGSTGSVMLNEYENDLMEDFKDEIRRIIRENGYRHWGNARSHLRSILVGNNQTIPIRDGRLELGTWQQIIFCNFDTRSRNRRIVVKVIGEG